MSVCGHSQFSWLICALRSTLVGVEMTILDGDTHRSIAGECPQEMVGLMLTIVVGKP